MLPRRPGRHRRSPLRIDLCERYSYLDAVCWVAEVGPQAMGVLGGGTVSNSTVEAVERLLTEP